MRNRILYALAVAFLLWMLPGCTGLDFSPDGKRLAVVWTDGILLLNVDGTGRAMIPGSRNGWMPTWSPDGRYVAFVIHRTNETNGDLMLYEVKTGAVRKIGQKLGPPFAWQSDGRRLAALRDSTVGDVELVTMEAPSGEERSRQLLSVKSVVGMSMIWLPGTQDVALVGQPQAPSARKAAGGDVCIASGSRLHRLTRTGDVIGLTLAHDGHRLLWARAIADASHPGMSIQAYDLQSGNVSALPFPPRIGGIQSGRLYRCDGIVYAAFSPDGARIAFVTAYTSRSSGSGEPSQYASCCTIRMDGSDPRMIDRTPPTRAALPFTLPVWSPDGKRIAVLTTGESTMRLSLYGPDGYHGGPILTARAR